MQSFSRACESLAGRAQVGLVFGGGLQNPFELTNPVAELSLVGAEFLGLLVDGRLLFMQLVDLLALGLDCLQRLPSGSLQR